MEMPGPRKGWKSRSSFSPLSTAPWESRQRREIATFPQPGIAPDGKVENRNAVSHFPTRSSRPRLRFVCIRNQKPRKETGRSAASSSLFRITLYWKRKPISGSSFDWKMLCYRERGSTRARAAAQAEPQTSNPSRDRPSQSRNREGAVLPLPATAS